jgi:CRP-like cAMP-binding protein
MNLALNSNRPQEGGIMLMSNKENHSFDPAEFLSRVGLGQRTVELDPEHSFFTQGDPADSVFCLQKGSAKLNVVSRNGKQTTIALFYRGDFFGEESLALVPGLRMATASAVNRCTALKINREELISVMRREHAFAEQFLSFLVARGMRTQADLVDQKLNCSEMRLARTLLLMAEFGKPDELQALIPPITQETLAEMIGTTRSRVSFFMNRFRSLGLITYKDRIQVHKPRLKAVLVNQFAEI